MGLKTFFKNLFGDDAPVVASSPATFTLNGTVEHTRFFARVAEAMTNYASVNYGVVNSKIDSCISFNLSSFDMDASLLHLLEYSGISKPEIEYLKNLSESKDHIEIHHRIPVTECGDFNASYYAEQVKKFYPSCTVTVKPDYIFAHSSER